jgi:hypothetical protein
MTALKTVLRAASPNDVIALTLQRCASAAILILLLILVR